MRSLHGDRYEYTDDAQRTRCMVMYAADTHHIAIHRRAGCHTSEPAIHTADCCIIIIIIMHQTDCGSYRFITAHDVQPFAVT